MGDEATVTLTGLSVESATSVFNSTSAGDTITGGFGDDWIIGGAGIDTINTGAGRNTVLGDYGTIRFANNRPTVVTSTQPTIGGNDSIILGGSVDVAIGGFGSDTFTDAGGQNAIVGDEGIVN